MDKPHSSFYSMSRFLLFCGLLAAIVVFGTRDVATQAAELGPDFSGGLFADSPSRVPVTVASEAMRVRAVEIDLASMTLDSAEQQPIEQLELNLFDDTRLTAILDNVQRNPSGSVTWSGTIDGDPYGHANFVVRDGVMVGGLSYQQAQYGVRLSPEGVQYIMQIDPRLYAEEANDYIPVEGTSVTPKQATAQSIDDGSIIDVIVGYTPDARNVVGGTAAIEALIELAFVETNTSYKNSNAVQRIALVHMFETADSENSTSTSTNLSQWRAVSDGQYDEVHALRDTYHADFAKLITGTTACGIAYLQTSANNVFFEDDAFGVSLHSCAVGNYTFGHELGHNMGLRHDWYVDGNITPFAYAHGFTNYQDGWRTVMAYNNRCSAASGSCTRLMYFSNPNNIYGGDPMGINSGGPTNCVQGSTTIEPQTCQADNTSVLNSQAATNSQFRVSQITWTGANGTDWNDAGNWEIIQGPANRPGGATSTVNRVPLSIDDVVIPGGLANYPTISSGTIVAREMVIQTGATLNMTGGTLTVSGLRWEEQGTGQFNGTGGTVIFHSSFDQTLTANANSMFNDVQFGNGNTQVVTLNSNLDINGNVTFSAGVSFKAGANTINIAGNFSDPASGFSAETSTVIFDGTAQTVDKTTTKTLLTEDFSAYPTCGCTASPPGGWGRSGNGSGFRFGNGQVYHWDDSTDAWLFTAGVTLEPGVNYTFSLDNWSWSQATSNLTIAYGTSQSSGAMNTTIGTLTDAQIPTLSQTSQFSFTVASSGTYYIGIHSVQSSFYTFLDNISLIGQSSLNFHNLEVASGETDFLKEVTVNGNLQTSTGGVADFGTNALTVEGVVSNNGSLKQTQTVANGVTSEFGRIKDALGTTDKYYGVEITPSTGSMGNTTVEIKGGQTCEASGIVSSGVQRCYVITPTTSQTSATRFYYRSVEQGSNTTPDVYQQVSPRSAAATWAKISPSGQGGSGDAVWTDASLTSYGTFALAESNAIVTLSGPTTMLEGNSGNTTLTYTATLNADISSGFAVPYTVSDGTANAVSDYIDNDGALSFAGTAGEQKTFTVDIVGDTSDENNETFVVALNTPSNGDVTVAGSPITTTIIDDDGAYLTINHTSGAVGSKFIVTGANFQASSTVSLTIGWPSRMVETVVATVNSDGSGGFVVTLDTTAYALAGDYTVTATDSNGGGAGTGSASFALTSSGTVHTGSSGTTVVIGMPYSVNLPIVFK